MEYSSPLAAMRPQPVAGWGNNRKDLPIPRSCYSTYGPNSFNFKDMSMQQHHKPSKHDYFTLKPVRGSSPTSSLTADLDANFHIDKRYDPHSSLGIYRTDHCSSPNVPTPRRSLFTAAFFQDQDDGQCGVQLQE
jgi:M-phase inducer tyrosine phosphatase